VSATLTMGLVAGFYGMCTARTGTLSPHLPWVLSFISASTSVLIGLIWLLCSATGTLGDMMEAVGLE